MKSTRIKLISAAFAAAIFMSGCQSSIYGKAADNNYDSFNNRQYRLDKIENIDLQGRFGMITSAERVSANFEYVFNSGAYTLEVTTPAGSQAALLSVNPDGKTSLAMGNKRYKGSDPRALFLREFGINLPFSMLKRIMLGIPEGVSAFDEQGRAILAHTEDFDITLGSYRNFNGYDLPTLFNIKSAEGNVIVKVNRLLKIE